MLYRFIDLFSGAIIPLVALLLIFGIVKKESAKKTVLIVLLTLYLAEMLDIVGVPYIQTWAWNPKINAIPFSDGFTNGFTFGVVFQFVANIVMFIPFGVLLPMIWRRFRRFRTTLIAGILLSACIEFLQLFTPRVTAADDLLMNTLGTIVGYWIIAGLLKKRWKTDCPETEIDSRRDSIELLIVAGLVFISSVFVKYTIGSLIYSLPMFP